mmetsp:Transcript_4958/g.16580  ORF Transcript_4958/g.16580 Transcript_4958/m.16580 type:complete len:283 (-) Transcript_4958:233-1081(-)
MAIVPLALLRIVRAALSVGLPHRVLLLGPLVAALLVGEHGGVKREERAPGEGVHRLALGAGLLGGGELGVLLLLRLPLLALPPLAEELVGERRADLERRALLLDGVLQAPCILGLEVVVLLGLELVPGGQRVAVDARGPVHALPAPAVHPLLHGLEEVLAHNVGAVGAVFVFGVRRVLGHLAAVRVEVDLGGLALHGRVVGELALAPLGALALLEEGADDALGVRALGHLLLHDDGPEERVAFSLPRGRALLLLLLLLALAGLPGVVLEGALRVLDVLLNRL